MKVFHKRSFVRHFCSENSYSPTFAHAAVMVTNAAPAFAGDGGSGGDSGQHCSGSFFTGGFELASGVLY
jgi:hypothetical protein